MENWCSNINIKIYYFLLACALFISPIQIHTILRVKLWTEFHTCSFHPIEGNVFVNKRHRGDLPDGGELRHGDHLLSHKYIRNTSTCATAPTEHLLNAGRKPQTSQKARNSPCTWVGQKKKQRQKNRDRTCTSGREPWRRKGYQTLEAPSRAETAGGGGGKLWSRRGEHSNR